MNMPQEPATLNLQIEIVSEQGDGRECGVCCLPCFGESSSIYFTAPIRQRLATMCEGCSRAWAEWRKTHES